MREYCAPLRDAEVDTVILGCTHYPLVGAAAAADPRARRHARHLGHGRRAQRRARAGRRAALLNPQPAEGSYRFQCTGDVESFKALGTRFLQMPLGEVVHVELGARR